MLRRRNNRNKVNLSDGAPLECTSLVYLNEFKLNFLIGSIFSVSKRCPADTIHNESALMELLRGSNRTALLIGQPFSPAVSEKAATKWLL